jgi:hypothetical protein
LFWRNCRFESGGILPAREWGEEIDGTSTLEDD